MHRLQRVAVAGNTAALILLSLVLAGGPLFFGSPEEPSPSQAERRAPAARGVLLFVVDGLRRDFAFDPGRMPNLARLAREGGRGMARVEALIPSTVSGIRTLAEGRVPPPISFLEDFRTSRAPEGGIFAAASAAGLRTFAAGPRLWTDLYGPWLDGSAAVATVATSGDDDERLLRAALHALEDPRGLFVVHCSGPDDAAHLHGPFSRAYAQALRRCDAALGLLRRRAGPQVAFLVTADHGVSDRGGHAGGEPAVVRTPVAVAGPGMPRGDLGEMRQRDLHRLILTPLGLALPERPSPPAPARRAAVLLTAALSLGSALVHWRHVATAARNRVPSTVLNATLWIALGLMLAGWHRAALVLILASLVGLTLLTRNAPSPTLPRSAGEGAATPHGAPLGRWRPLPGVSLGEGWGGGILALLAGAAFGLLRITDGRASTEVGLPAGALLALLTLSAVLAGALLARLLRRSTDSPALFAGLGCALVPPVLFRLAGETASLSTLDVRLAFRLVDGPLGLPGAVTAAALQPALPFLALLAGLGSALVRTRPEQAGTFAVGMAGAVAGQATAAALVFAFSPAASALGLLVRLAGEVNSLFLGSALVLALGGLAAGTARRRGARSRRPAATVP